MLKSTITIPNTAGLHTRSASKLVSTTTAFSCDIELGTAERMVDAKSILSIMLLAASQGSQLDIVLDGPDEEEALKAVQELVDNHFGES